MPFFRHLNFKKWSEPVSFLTDLQMRFSLQRRAIFYISSKQAPPHPPLYQAYFSTQPAHKSLKKHSISRLAQHFARLYLLSSDFRTFAQMYLLSSDSTSLLCFSSSGSASLLCFFNCPYCRKLDF